MGGIGSGTHMRWGARQTVNDLRAINIGTLSRDGWLQSGKTCTYSWSRNGKQTASISVTAREGSIVLSYRSRESGGEWSDTSYAVEIETTPCHLGGVRPWFLCPSQDCDRRVALLYGGDTFKCRHCNRLAYPSESEAPCYRALRRADKLRSKLRWPAGIAEGTGWGRPKHMHTKTYRRLLREYSHFEAVAESEFTEWIKRLTPETVGNKARRGDLRVD